MSYFSREISIWETLRSRITVPTKIFTLARNRPNEILKFDKLGITVKTDSGTHLVERHYIDFAWNNLLEDGVLFQNDHKKSTHRSSFILTLFVNYRLAEINSNSPLSIQLAVPNLREGDTLSLKKRSDYINNSEETHGFEDIYDAALFLLKREMRALSSIEIYRICYREGLIKRIKDISWINIDKLIKKEIIQNRERSLCIEIRQGVYDIHERIQFIKEKDPYDQIKEEYDWAYFEPISRILFQNKNYIIKKQINFLIPEISAYINSLDVDEKRAFLNSNGFKWRRKLGILNLNNMGKKTIFVDNLMKESLIVIKNYKYIELELDLNQNIINFDKYNSLFTKLGKVKFKLFKFNFVNSLK